HSRGDLRRWRRREKLAGVGGLASLRAYGILNFGIELGVGGRRSPLDWSAAEPPADGARRNTAHACDDSALLSLGGAEHRAPETWIVACFRGDAADRVRGLVATLGAGGAVSFQGERTTCHWSDRAVD